MSKFVFSQKNIEIKLNVLKKYDKIETERGGFAQAKIAFLFLKAGEKFCF